VVCRLAKNDLEATTIRLVLDNLHIHRRKSLTDFYGEEAGHELWDRFTIHDTPRQGSWLHQAESEISLFSRPCLGKRRIPDRKTLRHETRAWHRRIRRARTKINWQFDRKTARRKFRYKKHFYKRS
jgi:DDE superfamily endonuclease